jgi:hypothetical protein
MVKVIVENKRLSKVSRQPGGVIFIMTPLFLLQIVHIFIKTRLWANVWCDILIIVGGHTSFYTTIQRCKISGGSK